MIRIVVALGLLLVAGCQLVGPGKTHPDGDGLRVVVSDDVPPARDPVEILAAEVQGAALHLRVQYSGGCADHDWALHASTNFARSLPPIASLWLGHDANGDLCEALPTETLVFDLDPAFTAWHAAGHRGDLVLAIHTPGTGGSVTQLTVTL